MVFLKLNKMGFWKNAGKFVGKQAERALLLISGKEWGDAANDSDKIVAALQANHNVQLNNERLAAHENNSTLVYAIISFIVVAVVLIVAVCFKLAVDTVRNNNTTQQSIQLNTLRRNPTNTNSSNGSV